MLELTFSERVVHTRGEMVRLAISLEMSEMLVRLRCAGFISHDDDEDHWTYVRSWGLTPGTTEYVEIVSVLDGNTVESIRVDGHGYVFGTPYRGTPRQVVDRLLDFGFSQAASRVLYGGWWWGKQIGRTDLLHATWPQGAMPPTTTSLCATPMTCHGPNRPADETPLCPACCIAIVERVVAIRPYLSVVEEGID